MTWSLIRHATAWVVLLTVAVLLAWATVRLEQLSGEVKYLGVNQQLERAPTGCPLYLSRHPLTDRRDTYEPRCWSDGKD